MPDIKTGCIYAPLIPFQKHYEDHETVFCFDQQKRNLLHLLAPHVTDLYAVKEVTDIARDIHTMMSVDLRDALRKSPRTFLRWLFDNDYATMAIFQNAPDDFISVMIESIKQLNLSIEGENVLRVAFSKAA